MPGLLKGKPIAEKIKEKTAEKVAELKTKGITPKLAVILVGEDKPSQTYVRKKGQAAEKVGMDFELVEMPGDSSKADIIYKIKKLQADPQLTGLIVQLPLPEPLYTEDVLNAIDPAVDVDCLTNVNLGRLVMKTNYIVPPTPGAVMSVLHSIDNYDLAGKNVVIIGVGALVGKPLAIMMMNERASVTTCNSATKDTKEKCLTADIIVTGIGKKDIVRGDMVKSGAIVVDTGVCFVDDKMYGDVNVEEVLNAGASVTPTPGGVGPITVARLLWNTAICAERCYDSNTQILYESTENYGTTYINKNGEKLIFKNLSYKINGLLFEIHNELGRYCNEQQFCDALENKLKENKINYEREKILPPSFEGEKDGRNRVDFLVEDKIIIEAKAKRYLTKEDYYQLQRYLKALNKQLGVLVNFRDERITPKRVLNPDGI